jgi:hypothetical protein
MAMSDFLKTKHEPLPAPPELDVVKPQDTRKRKRPRTKHQDSLKWKQIHYTAKVNKALKSANAAELLRAFTEYYLEAPYPYRLRASLQKHCVALARSEGISEEKLSEAKERWKQSIISESAKFSEAEYPWIQVKGSGHFVRFISERKFEHSPPDINGVRSWYSYFIHRGEKGFTEIQKFFIKERKNEEVHEA